MITAPWCVIEAERQSILFEEEQRRQRKGYIDPNLEEEVAEARRQLLSPKDRMLDWAERRRYGIIGASWALSMAGERSRSSVVHISIRLICPDRCRFIILDAFGIIMRDP